MIRKAAFLFFLVCGPLLSFSQELTANCSDTIGPSTSKIDYEKGYFSEELGFQVDTVQNVNLYYTAIDWLSTHYHFGGHSKAGIDCSGFANILYNNAYNITLSRGSKSIFQSDVVPIDKEQLKEGDLVFFKIRRRKISHVGVYLGKNKFVHASTQLGVIVSDLDEPYYKKYFFKAGRHKNFSSL